MTEKKYFLPNILNTKLIFFQLKLKISSMTLSSEPFQSNKFFTNHLYVFLAADYTRLYVGRVKFESTLKEENLRAENVAGINCRDRNLGTVCFVIYRDILFPQLLIFLRTFFLLFISFS